MKNSTLIRPPRFLHTRTSLLRIPSLVFASVLLFPSLGVAQTGTISGSILSAATGEPLTAAQISLEDLAGGVTDLGGMSHSSGQYLLLNIPVGQYLVRVQLIGFGTQTQVAEVAAGVASILDFRLEPEAISLSEIVVTGVVGATQRTKLPFEVTQLRMADLPVARINAVESLQGKVAGVQVVQGNGLQGSPPSVLLRGVTALDANGRSQDPLYMVDGVILGSEMLDIGAMDIQSIEVVKGAAAASLFGSRAGNGIVHIRTRRGAELPDDEVRYTVRSEFGRSNLVRIPDILNSKTHYFALTPDGSAFLDNDGQPCPWMECGSLALAGQRAGTGTVTNWNTFQTNPFPGTTYNQVERFFTHGDFLQNHLSLEGRSGRFNFFLSGSHLRQEGIVRYLPGYERTNVRLNVDQAVRPGLTVESSVFFSRSSQPSPGLERGAISGLKSLYPSANLLAEDPEEPGEMVFIVGPESQVNPLYALKNRREMEWRGRVLASTTIRYSPQDWLQVDGNISFDRADRKAEDYIRKGYKTINPNAWLNDGSLVAQKFTTEALNGSITATGRWALGDRIQNRTQFRYLIETRDYDGFWTEGYQFAVDEVPVFDNINQETTTAGSDLETIRADGVFLLTNFDILDRYVLDLLVRNDGSSLFGVDERRQWYYRMAGAWRVSQEDFLDVDGVDELKLRYSVGTAGGRPQFIAQYETIDVQAGRIFPNRLGNRDLRPEFSTEHEAGLDLSLFNYRAMLSLTYAHNATKDQILQVPQASLTGYVSQWRNAGTLKSRTWEATLDLRLIQKPSFTWKAKLLFDATKSRVTALNTPPFSYGQPPIYYAQEGGEVGALYGTIAARSCADLPWGTLAEVGCDEFVLNDDGFLVWVGANGSLSNPQWGIQGPTIGGRPTVWGTPLAGVCLDRETWEQTDFCHMGNSLPDYNLGLSTSLAWGGFSLYALFSRSAGFQVYNYPLMVMARQTRTGISDQSGIPEEEQKPIGYYQSLYDLSGGGGFNDIFVEDGDFTKLRELSISYRLNSELLEGVPGLRRFQTVALNLTGQNLFLWTDYRGFDPDVGVDGGDTGSAAIARFDRYAHPNMRIFTGSLEFVF